MEPGHLDPRGVLRDEVIQRWIIDARDEYLDQCRQLRARQRSGLLITTRDRDFPSGARLAGATGVTVSAGATEIHPTSFTMAFRVRGTGTDDDVVVNATSIIGLEDPKSGEAQEIDATIRDDLIALEHAARHIN